MADVTGPISTLPGAEHSLPAGTMCDDHPDRPAYKRVQGETDSMGCEMYDMCCECYDAHKAAMKTMDRSGCCDWCKQPKPVLHKHRDFEEGSCGPVYAVCNDCIKRQRDALEDELEELGYYDY